MMHILQGDVEGYTEFVQLTRIGIIESSTSKMNLVALCWIFYFLMSLAGCQS